MNEFLLVQQDVTWSMLQQGFTISVQFQQMFQEKLGLRLAHGEKRQIRIELDGVRYTADLINLGFDRRTYAEHKDILQIRYNPTDPIALALRNRFSATWEFAESFRRENFGKQKRITVHIPPERQEFLALYAAEPGVLLADCITNEEYRAEAEEIRKADERVFEESIENASDPTAAVVEKTGTRKLRRLSRAIGENLKQVYEYRCQICGERVGTQYGCGRLIHAHHIDFFTRSLNNDAGNILIVCPNHHGVIHDRNPEFDRATATYRYPNGYVEGLLLNRHIGRQDPAK